MLKSLITLAVFLASLIAEGSRQKAIYGPDDRKDIYQVQNTLYKKLALSTAGMIHHSAFGAGSSDSVKEIYFPQTLEQGINVCRHEKFSQQIIAPSCSGFLVGEDLLVTAGHCYLNFTNPQNVCQDFQWVFGYEMKSPIHDPTKNIKKSDIYHCKEIVKIGLNKDYDFALIRLDRKVEGRPVLKFRESGKINNGTHILAIGHPSGLPTKLTTGLVTRNSEETRFSANLDTFQGNSGSAVFNARTGLVEGILIQGKADYIHSDPNDPDSCLVSNRCSQNARSCSKNQGYPVDSGEVVLRISAIASEIKNALKNTDNPY